MSDENHYFGEDCPVGMVQVESVRGVGEQRPSGHGWKPVPRTVMIDVYVDGQRFCITAGTYESHKGPRRGLHIVTTKLDLAVDKHSMNSVDLFFEHGTTDTRS